MTPNSRQVAQLKKLRGKYDDWTPAEKEFAKKVGAILDDLRDKTADSVREHPPISGSITFNERDDIVNLARDLFHQAYIAGQKKERETFADSGVTSITPPDQELEEELKNWRKENDI